jgi:uridine kinase/ribulose-5-phosphate 4-epimerase/fuculose-1-phosphate aldolase
MNSYIIGVAGESGVGKTTISKIISTYFGDNNTTVLSTDDLHKWERKNPMWKSYTHNNPDANNLDLGDQHLLELCQGHSIFRSTYNHSTGYFNAPIKISPSSTIIIEGLHSFYTDFSKRAIDLKIYVDTEDSLRTHWKIIRDTEERGYKYSTVLDNINKRRKDSCKVREGQINSADVIITIKPKHEIVSIGDKNEEVEIEISFTFINRNHQKLFEFIQNYNVSFNEFIDTSENVGGDITLCQNGGGNLSIKIDDKFMFIKASGYDMKDVYKTKGYSLIEYPRTIMLLKEAMGDDGMHWAINPFPPKDKAPSMETGFHVLLDKYVLHLHPVYVTTLLCLKNSKKIIESMYSNYEYEYIEYVNPGFNLYDAIKKTNMDKEIYFLENHGIILTSNNLDNILETLDEINKIAKDRLDNKEFNSSSIFQIDYTNFAFPDAVIFNGDISKKDTLSAHNYIIKMGSKLGEIKYLSEDDVKYLKKMKAEKYRKNI